MKLFKRSKKKSYLVYLGRRGSRRLLGRLEVENGEDVALKLDNFITERCKELNIKPEEYPRVHVVDVETGSELKTENPFWEAPEMPEASGGSSGPSPKDMGELLRTALGLQGELYKAVFDGVADGLKNIVSSSLSLAQDLVNTVKVKAVQAVGGASGPSLNMSSDDLIKMLLLSSVAQRLGGLPLQGVSHVGGAAEGKAD